MKKIARKSLIIIASIPMPITLLMVCVLAYGLLIPWLGFYLDDWYIILFQKYFGARQFSQFFAQDRPLFGYVYQVFVPIFKDSRIAWQIFAVFTHALAATSFWWLLRKLIPERNKVTATAALFFAVYPGFQFHWFSVMYSQVFILMAIYFLSYILMIESVTAKKGRLFFTIGALICLIIGIVPQETFLGLELVRPLILGLILWRRDASNAKKFTPFILHWVPYLSVFIGFVIFRLSNSSAYSYQANLFTDLSQNPVPTILRLISEVFWGSVDSIFTAWVQLIELLRRDLLTTVSISVLILVLVGIGLSWFILRKKEDAEVKTHNYWILWISLFATISAMAPFIAGSFKVTLDFPNNRYLIALAPGACLFLAVLIDTIIKPRLPQLLISITLIGFAIGSQFLTARSYMLSWQAQQDFFWQLSWRIPGIQADTMLVTEDLPFSIYYSGPSLTAPLNLIYAPESSSHEIPYLLLLNSQQGDLVSAFEPNQVVSSTFRTFEFNGNTSSMIVFKKYADGCLRIISPQDSAEEFANKNDKGFWKSAVPLSNPGQILLDERNSAIVPVKYFGQENRNQWCYFFEKADLARQQQKWDQTIQIYEDAANAEFVPLIETEWLPLLEAYLKTNNLDKALELTMHLNDRDTTSVAGFCQLWSNAKADETVIPYAQESQSWLNCRVINEE